MTPSTENSGLRLVPQTMGKSIHAAKLMDLSDDTGDRPAFAGLVEALNKVSVSTAASQGTIDPSAGSTGMHDGVPEDDGHDSLVLETTLITMASSVFVTVTGPTPVQAATQATADADMITNQRPQELEQAVIATASETTPGAGVAGAAATTVAMVTTQAPGGPLTDRRSKVSRDLTQPATANSLASSAPNAQQAGTTPFPPVSGSENRAEVARPETRGMEYRFEAERAGTPSFAMAGTMTESVLPDGTPSNPVQVQVFDTLTPVATRGDQPTAITAPETVRDPVTIMTTDPNWEVDFVDSIVAQVTGEDAVIDLSLSPDNLGKVEVRVELREGRADVTFVTETREAARLFAQAEGRLSDLMQRHGLDLGGQASSQRDSSARQSTGHIAQTPDDLDRAPAPRLSREGRVNLVA